MGRGDGSIFQRPGSKFLWCVYYKNGKKFVESTKQTDVKKAREFLKDRLHEIRAENKDGTAFVTPQMRRLRIHDELERLKKHFELNDQATPQNLSHLRRADKDLGHYSLQELLDPEKDIVDAYKERRKLAGDRPASINRVLQMVRQACNLAHRKGRLNRKPFIEMFSEKGNRRTGFCEEPEFRRIHDYLPHYLRDVALFGYCTGMRLGEILSLRWEFVRGDVIELQPEDAKGDGDEANARLIPMSGRDLAGILERRRAARQVKNGETTTICTLIFHHGGKRIVDIRKAWKAACRKAGVPKRLFHDLRRSAIMNLEEAGVSRDVAMSLSGHRTESVYSRYNIANVKRKRSALQKAQEFRDAQAAGANEQTNVLPMTAEK